MRDSLYITIQLGVAQLNRSDDRINDELCVLKYRMAKGNGTKTYHARYPDI